MKTRTLAALGTGVIAAAFATGAMAGSAPGTGMAGSGHDGVSQGFSVAMCVECHTPHAAASTMLLWNHDLSSSTFKWDVPATTAGTPYPTTSGKLYNGPSTKCLSCHDGTLATQSNEWYEQKFSTGTFKCGMFGTGWCVIGGLATPPTQVGVGAGTMAGTHPVMMPYPANRLPSTYNGTTTGVGLDAGTYSWIDDPTLNGIRLYTDNGSGIISAAKKGALVIGQTGMECGSCHDVHNGERVQGDYLVTGQLTGNTGGPNGYICQKCHNK